MQFTLHHLHWRCRDIQASLGFYLEKMGASLLKHYHTAYNLEIYLLSLGNITLALSPAGQSGGSGSAIYQVALQVSDIEAAVKRLEDQGVPCKSGILEPSPGVRAAMFDDPDGVEIELIQV